MHRVAGKVVARNDETQHFSASLLLGLLEVVEFRTLYQLVEYSREPGAPGSTGSRTSS